MIAIIGAGLAGLSCAIHLRKRGLDYTVFEKLDQPGGLCRSYEKNGYTFDLAGHFLHFRSKAGTGGLRQSFQRDLELMPRKASVRTHGVRVPFPFQAHLGALPAEVNLECLVGFIDAALAAASRTKPRLASASAGHIPRLSERFDHWVVETFGRGMAEHFFFPYNSKFFKRDLARILVDWTAWSVPRPSVEEVVRGALCLSNEGMGYNPKFYYPNTGGSGAIVQALAQKVKNIRLNSAAREIDTRRKILTLESGEEFHYDGIVSTAPLPTLVSMVRGADTSMKRAARALSWLAVDCAQLGIRQSGVFDDHWSYIPEREYPFYRVGGYPGEGKGTRLFVEFTRRNNGRFQGEAELVDAALSGLKKLGILKNSNTVDEAHVVTLDPAYVVHDNRRRKDLPRLLSWLRRRGIQTIGRYGAWEYSSMEDALIEGYRAAESF